MNLLLNPGQEGIFLIKALKCYYMLIDKKLI